MHMTGDPDGPPMMVGSALGDTNGAVHGFASLGYALYHRERTGRGQYIDSGHDRLPLPLPRGPARDEPLHERRVATPSASAPTHNVVFPAGVFKAPEGWIVDPRPRPAVAERLPLHRAARPARRPPPADHRRTGRAPGGAGRHRRGVDGRLRQRPGGARRVGGAPRPAGRCCRRDALDHPHFKAREMVRWVPTTSVGGADPRVPLEVRRPARAARLRAADSASTPMRSWRNGWACRPSGSPPCTPPAPCTARTPRTSTGVDADGTMSRSSGITIGSARYLPPSWRRQIGAAVVRDVGDRSRRDCEMREDDVRKFLAMAALAATAGIALVACGDDDDRRRPPPSRWSSPPVAPPR